MNVGSGPIGPDMMGQIEAAEGEWLRIVNEIVERGITVQRSEAEQKASERVADLKAPVGLCVSLGCRGVPRKGRAYCGPCRGEV